MLPLGGGGSVGDGPGVGVAVGCGVGGRSVRVMVGVPVAVAVEVGTSVVVLVAVGSIGVAVGFGVVWATVVGVAVGGAFSWLQPNRFRLKVMAQSSKKRFISLSLRAKTGAKMSIHCPAAKPGDVLVLRPAGLPAQGFRQVSVSKWHHWR